MPSQAEIKKTFEQRTARYIASRTLLHAGAPVVVALSGGADSVALLAALSSLGYDCRAAHCNFHLRGEESMRDSRHCHMLCETLGVDLYVRDFDVEARRREHPGESVEMACRELRYAWFAELLDREGAQAVAVGHHREDRAETFMLNLMRGSGINGLTSMRPRSGAVVRPLLPFSRAEIEAYVEACGLTFITDSSNASDAHRRNRLRNRVFPLLEELFPGAGDAVLRTISHLEAAGELYSEVVAERRQRYFPDGRSIDLALLKSSEPQAPTLLFEFLRPLAFTYTQVCDMIDASSSSGAVFHSTDGETVAEINRGQLVVSDARRLRLVAGECYTVNPARDITEPIRIAVTSDDVFAFRPEALGPSVAYLDAAALEGNPLWELRHWRRGDRIIPFGAKKSKLVSDLYAAARFSAEQKRNTWILTRNDEIVWIPCLRNSALFAVGPGTKRFLRLQVLEGEL
ncbi:MAG: tRNA lysidine(34) synthetase TilS [Bacteroidales bacterium]|nr:tRNA lysidine(34) synthetase TilS [Bacteroidales bacterium]